MLKNVLAFLTCIGLFSGTALPALAEGTGSLETGPSAVPSVSAQESASPAQVSVSFPALPEGTFSALYGTIPDYPQPRLQKRAALTLTALSASTPRLSAPLVNGCYGSKLSGNPNAAAIYNTLVANIGGVPQPGTYPVEGFQPVSGAPASDPFPAGTVPDCETVDLVMEALDLAQNAFFNDYPEIFWLSGISVNLTHTSDFARIEAVSIVIGDAQLAEEYTNWEDPARDQVLLSNVVDSLFAELELASRSDYQKLLAIHDWLVKNVAYDLDVASEFQADGSFSTRRPFNATGALLDGSAVCDGYVKAFLLLCQKAGISCLRVTGKGSGSSDVPLSEDHSWNLARLEGQWYAVDVTWDDPLWNNGTSDYPGGENMRHTFFLAGADTFHTGNHAPDAELAAVLPALSATGYRSSETPAGSQRIPVSGVTLDRDSLSFVTTGDAVAVQLHATIWPDDASNQAVIWLSGDRQIASVSSQGLVTPHALGETDITVQTVDGRFTASCHVTVDPTNSGPYSIQITPYDPAMGTVTISPTENIVDGTVVTVTVQPNDGYQVYRVTANQTPLAIPPEGGTVYLSDLFRDVVFTVLFAMEGSDDELLIYAGYTGSAEETLQTVINSEQAIAALRSSPSSRVEIVIREDAMAESALFRAAAETGKILSVRVTDADGNFRYRWEWNGSEIRYSQISMDLSYALKDLSRSSFTQMQDALPAGTLGAVVSLQHSGTLPGPASLEVPVQSRFADGVLLNAYYFDASLGQYVWADRNIAVQDGRVTLSVRKGGNYLLTEAILSDALEPSDLETDVQQAAAGMSGQDVQAPTEIPPTGDDAPAVFWPLFLLAGAVLPAAAARLFRRSRSDHP